MKKMTTGAHGLAPPCGYANVLQPDRIAFALNNFLNYPICDDLAVTVFDPAAE
jgi:hypothetical protein